MGIVYDDEQPPVGQQPVGQQPVGQPPAIKYDDQPARDLSYKGSVLPLSRDAQGNVKFDPFGAGPIGAMREAFTLPGRVASGETRVDPSNPAFIGETLNFAGSFGPGVNPMVRSGDRVIPGIKMAPKDLSLAVTPSVPQLLEKGGSQIEAYKNLPIPYNPAYMGTLANKIEQKLVDEVGAFPEDAPGLYSTIRRFHDYVPRSNDPNAVTSVGPANLISMRKNIANKFGVPGENQKAVGVAHEVFNDFLEKPPPEALVAGAPAFLAAYGPELYSRGRANYAAGMQAKALEDIKRTADLKAASANSGLNPDNSLRSRVTSHILDAQKIKGYDEAQLAALEAVPVGTTQRNVLRYAGNVMGGGGGMGAGAAAGIVGGAANALGVPSQLATGLGAATPVVGAALKRAAGKSTEAALDEVIDMSKRRSPLFKEMSRQDLVPDVVSGRDAMARTLMRMYSQPYGVPVQKPVLEYDPNRA